ncbi:YutD family protein [Limosilactobacillus oris]
MNRAKIQDYIDQREEQRADLYHYEATDEKHFQLNGHAYELVKEYRHAFDGEEFAKRFSNILSKYDYIVGDWGYEQLRLTGFYDRQNPLYNSEHGVETIEDFLYEDCNFGCAYFIVHNDSVHLPRQHRRRKANQPDVKHRRNQHAKRVRTGKHQQKFVIRSRKQGDKD